MIFIALLILVTFAIAASAAFFSVYGLAYTFSGTFWGVVVMGASLEAGKLMGASYLYRYWDKTHVTLRAGLLAVILGVMLLTSGGIFGFLSSGYQADVLPLKQKADQVKLLDEERTRSIARKQQIDDLMTKNTTVVTTITGADGTIDKNATRLLRESTRSRESMVKQYKEEQKQVTARIIAIDKEILPLKQELIKTEAHTGPIIYIAKAFSLDSDNATKYLIYLIIFSFDPMAIFLTLAANIALNFRKKEKEQKKIDNVEQNKVEVDSYNNQEQVQHLVNDAIKKAKTDLEIEYQSKVDSVLKEERERYSELLQSSADQSAAEEEIAELSKTVRKVTEDFNALVPVIISLEEECVGLTTQDDNLKNQLKILVEGYDELLDEKITLENTINELGDKAETADTYLKQLAAVQQEIIDKNTEIEKTTLDLASLHKVIDEKNRELLLIKQEFMDRDAAAQKEISNRDVTIQDLYLALQQEVAEKNKLLLQNMQPTVKVVASPETPIKKITVGDNLPLGGNANFGVAFPTTPINGDLFLRVDFMPSKLFKWVGSRWVEIDKSVTDAYAFDIEYIKLLVNKVSSGEYDIDDLSAIEQEQVAKYLNDHQGK